MKDRPGYIYVIRSIEWCDWYKIGRSTKPDQRFKQIKQSDDIGQFGFVPVLLFKSKDCVAAEHNWHTQFAKNRMHGEWFELTQFHIRYLVQCEGIRAGRLQRRTGYIREWDIPTERWFSRYHKPYLDRFWQYYDRKNLGMIQP